MTGLISLSKVILVAIINETRGDHIMTVPVENRTEADRKTNAECSCVVAQVKNVLPMSERTWQAKNLCGGIQLAATNENLVLKQVAGGAQRIGDTTPGIPFFIKNVTLSLTCTTLPKRMKLSSCAALPQSRLE